MAKTSYLDKFTVSTELLNIRHLKGTVHSERKEMEKWLKDNGWHVTWTSVSGKEWEIKAEKAINENQHNTKSTRSSKYI